MTLVLSLWCECVAVDSKMASIETNGALPLAIHLSRGAIYSLSLGHVLVYGVLVFDDSFEVQSMHGGVPGCQQ